MYRFAVLLVVSLGLIACANNDKKVSAWEVNDVYQSTIATPNASGGKTYVGPSINSMDEDNTYGGKVVTNPSGGLLSKGHPLGATGLAQCTELVWQLRGTADQRQVAGARVALQHNLGLGGACVVTMYRRD